MAIECGALRYSSICCAGDLQMLVRLASAQGADVIGLNPLHGMFSDDPEHASPYSPASRLLLNILRCMQRHRHSEFIRFLNAVEREVPAGGARQLCHPQTSQEPALAKAGVLAGLSRHPRWTFHFTPTSASWLNAVENFFSKMTRQRIRRGVLRSIVDLQSAINAYLAEQNAHPKPFV
jgi:transposase